MEKGISIFGCLEILIMYFIVMIGVGIITGLIGDFLKLKVNEYVCILLVYLMLYIYIHLRFHLSLRKLHSTNEIKIWIIVMIVSCAVTVVANYIKFPIGFGAFDHLKNEVGMGKGEALSLTSLYYSYGSVKEFLIDIFEVIFMVIIIPSLEEILFRGYIFNGLQMRTNFIIAAIISSLVFALIHSLTDFKMIIGVFVSAMIWCIILKVTGNITCCIAAHSINNLLGLGLTILAKYAPYYRICIMNKYEGENMLIVNPIITIISIIICIGFVGCMISKIYKFNI